MPASNYGYKTYQDDLGNPVILGKELARGGEGMVCLVEGKPDVVAKIYLDKTLLKRNKAEKIKAMCNLYDPDIAQYNAIPQKAIFNSKGKVTGFIMEKVTGFEEIHNLYGVTRKKFFGFADWKFMVHAAKNLAIAVDKLHGKNIVIGDINQGNVLVNNQAMIKLIDCDSYQVEYNGKFYLCEVGVPDYTSPELQGQSFHGIQRTKNHDCFGLAVMIFQILTLGRHPYSGVGAPSEIPDAITKNCYCYGNNAKNKTPIHSKIASEAFNDEIKELFERSFAKKKNCIRPTAEEWIEALDNFERSLLQCSADSMHKYPASAHSCIWCQLARQGYNPFVKSQNHTKPVSKPANKKPNYQQTPYTAPAAPYQNASNQSISNLNAPNQNKFKKWCAKFFKNHPYLSVVIIFSMIFSFVSGISETADNSYTSAPKYENTESTKPEPPAEDTNTVQETLQEENTAETTENKETADNSPETKQTSAQKQETTEVKPVSQNAANPAKSQPAAPKTTPKNPADDIKQAPKPPQPKKPAPPPPKPKTDLQKSTDDFFE